MMVMQKMPVMFTARMSPDGMKRGRKNITTASTAAPVHVQRRGSLGGV